MGEGKAYKWAHTVLPYGLAYFFAIKAPTEVGWVWVPFAFSALMCRVITAKELSELAKRSEDILKRRKPDQGRLIE